MVTVRFSPTLNHFVIYEDGHFESLIPLDQAQRVWSWLISDARRDPGTTARLDAELPDWVPEYLESLKPMESIRRVVNPRPKQAAADLLKELDL